MKFTPHDQLTPGFWYLRTQVEPYYCIVSLTQMVIGPDAGTLGVFMIDHEGHRYIEDFDDDQFIGPVPAP